MQSLLILGRQPNLGIAELESLYGSQALRPVGEQAVIVDIDPCELAFTRLGGSIKFCKVLTTLESSSWSQVETFLSGAAPEHAKAMPEGKMQLGLSSYGFKQSTAKLTATGLTLKKAIKKTGRNVRLIPNNDLELSSAQVIHNHLTGRMGWELCIIADGPRTVIAQTVMIQDIEDYTRRDRERPKRDAKVGMLPPKLAQIIINLAAGRLERQDLISICEIPENTPRHIPSLGKSLLDPFCGTGVILQEAALMGYQPYGSDIDRRMADYSAENLHWLESQYGTEIEASVFVADATTAQWEYPVQFLASETYLGRPFTQKPSPEILAQTVSECNLIIKKFLKNWRTQHSEARLCLAVPAWQTAPGVFRHLPLIDQIEDLGYNRISFEHSSADQLIYYRPDQFVARQLIVLSTK